MRRAPSKIDGTDLARARPPGASPPGRGRPDADDGAASPPEALEIAVFASAFPAPGGAAAVDRVAGLLRRGHEVAVFADRASADPLTYALAHRFDLRRRTRYLHAPKRPTVRVARVPLMFARYWWDRPLTGLAALAPVRRGGEDSFLRAFYWASQMPRSPEFDILHCHSAPVASSIARLREIGAIRGRLVATLDGADLAALRSGPRHACRGLFARGDLFLSACEAWRRGLVELGCDPARIAVHHEGVDLARYRSRPRAVGGRRPMRILTVGRLAEGTGVEFGLRAVEKALGRGLSLHYAVVGTGPLRPALERFARSRGIEGFVRFHGEQSPRTVAALMETHDVLLVPAITDGRGRTDGIPVSAVQGMASGMPVVAFRHGGIPELVEHGRSGLLIPEAKVDGLAEALWQLALYPESWASLGAAGRARVEAEFDAEKLDAALERRFHALAGRPADRPADANPASSASSGGTPQR